MTALSIILTSGDFDRIHYALVTATTAAALDHPVTILITLRACQAFVADMSGDCTGWKALSLSSSADGIAATTPSALNQYFRENHIATFEELLEAAKELPIHFMACEMGLRAENITLDQLDKTLSITASGMASFLRNALGSTILTF